MPPNPAAQQDALRAKGGRLIPHKAAAMVLQRAADKVGGDKELAKRLNVSLRLLERYKAGTEPVPEAVYLDAVDIVLGDDDRKTS